MLCTHSAKNYKNAIYYFTLLKSMSIFNTVDIYIITRIIDKTKNILICYSLPSFFAILKRMQISLTVHIIAFLHGTESLNLTLLDNRPFRKHLDFSNPSTSLRCYVQYKFRNSPILIY